MEIKYEELLEMLFQQYSEKLFNMAYRRLNDVEKAYDAVSETFVIASQKS